MGTVDRVDDMTFKVNFSSEGLVKLRDVVNDKLKEFMGDYTDDNLVDYVIVLLRNGRRKDEARNELNVFLGDDDSEAFVSWLWVHLASNLDQYVHPQESLVEKAVKAKPSLDEQVGTNNSLDIDSYSDRGKSKKLTRSRRNSEWRGSGGNEYNPPPLLGSRVDDSRVKEKDHHKASHVRRSHSPESSRRRKRDRHEDGQHAEKETVSQATADAPRRLLQFAVRDAVESLKSSNSVKEPSQKRLRSVVAMSTDDSSVVDRPKRIRSVARVPNSMATVIRAVAEAADDVRKAKTSRSVFDRLGPDMDLSEAADHVFDSREAAVEEDEYSDYDQIQEATQPMYFQRSNYNEVRNREMLESETGLASDFMSDDEGYDDANHVDRRVVNLSRIGVSVGNKDDVSLKMQYNMVKTADGIKHNQPAVATNNSSKIVNSSSSVSTWKSPHYQEPRQISGTDGNNYVHEAGAAKSGVQLMKENNISAPAGNGNARPIPVVQRESQKMPHSGPGARTAGPPLEDADSRTIFVSNVHFAATKDSLSRHFNKFGEVLKVVIVTDAATGQPKGAAYVEFMRKEAAENALSLDGTSFMSRIVKVVKKSSAPQETASAMTWPRVAHGSPYSPARFARVPFPRGVPGPFRARPPMKAGARSLQWKRDAQGTSETGASAPGNIAPSPISRSLTYVRTEPKPEGNSGTV